MIVKAPVDSSHKKNNSCSFQRGAAEVAVETNVDSAYKSALTVATRDLLVKRLL